MDNRKTSFFYGLFDTCTYTINCLPPRPPKILHCFQFLLTAVISRRNEKQRLCLKFWWANKVHYRCKWPILGCCAGRGMVFVLSVLNRVYNSAKVYPKPVYMSFVLNGVYQGRRLKKAIYVFYQLLVLKRCCVEFAFLVLGTST